MYPASNSHQPYKTPKYKDGETVLKTMTLSHNTQNMNILLISLCVRAVGYAIQSAFSAPKLFRLKLYRCFMYIICYQHIIRVLPTAIKKKKGRKRKKASNLKSKK